MPDIIGPDLAQRLQAVHPELRVVLVSAYGAGTLRLEPGWTFLPKPFSPRALLDTIAFVLDQRSRPSEPD